MTWEVRYKRTFLKELSRLPATARKRVEEIAFGKQIKDDPFLLGKTPELVGYKSFYKIRVGSYRIGLQIDTETHLVEFMRVLHRREIYRKFP
jgi:mRNA interferase RelE/StbE